MTREEFFKVFPRLTEVYYTAYERDKDTPLRHWNYKICVASDRFIASADGINLAKLNDAYDKYDLAVAKFTATKFKKEKQSMVNRYEAEVQDKVNLLKSVLEGNLVEFRRKGSFDPGEWELVDQPEFNFAQFEYRRANPPVGFIAVRWDGTCERFDTEKEALDWGGKYLYTILELEK